MPRIFLSYRRSDSQDITGRIYDCLLTEFGPGQVFRDIDAIPPGLDFKQHLIEAVGQCQVLLAVVGPHWVDAQDEAGTRRLDRADDIVRIEIEAALARGIPVVPVLVAHAPMPAAAELPAGLALFADRQAIQVRSDPDFHADMDRLYVALHRLSELVKPKRDGALWWVAPASDKPARPTARPSGGEGIDSLAVLPFVNSSGDPEMEYLGDGIADSLINSFSQLRKLRVVPRSLVFRYKGSDMDPQAAGRQLNARAVLTGRVSLRGDTLLIGTELLDVATVSQLWGAQYNRHFTDIFAVQEDIAKEISKKLRLQLSREEKTRLVKRATQNKEAYQLYLKAMYFWNRGGLADWTKALGYAQQAIEKDPNYATAYAVASISYSLLGFFVGLAPAEAFPKAKAAALKALDLDERLPRAHTSLALIRLFYDWNWAGAESECQRALELNPDDPLAQYVYCAYLLAVGQIDRSVAEARRGLELDPLFIANQVMLAYGCFCGGKYDDAVKACEMVLEVIPTEAACLEFMAFIRAHQGRYDEAIAACQNIPAGTGLNRAMLAYCYAMARRADESRNILEELKHLPERSLFVLYPMAGVYTALGEFDRAFELLNKLCDERAGVQFTLGVHPMLAPLRADPRFHDLLRRMNLPTAVVKALPRPGNGPTSRGQDNGSHSKL